MRSTTRSAILAALILLVTVVPAAARQAPNLLDTDLTAPWWLVDDGTCPALSFEGWSSLPGDPGTDETVYALDSAGQYVFAGGGFGTAGGLAATHIARWDGGSWSDLSGPSGNGVNGAVFSVRALGPMSNFGDDSVLVGGIFDEAGGVDVSNIAFWSDSYEWRTSFHDYPEELGPNGIVQALSDPDAADNSIYVGGTFDGEVSPAGDVYHEYNGFRFSDHPNAAWWDIQGGAHFWPFDIGPLDGSVYTMLHFDDGGGEDLYLGGLFVDGGSGTVNHIARVGAAGYEALGDGFDNAVLSLETYSAPLFAPESLYAAGVFQNSDTTSLDYVARWDGNTWHDLDGGMNSSVQAILSANIGDGNKLYATGSFTVAGTKNANYVARWTGSEWKRMGKGLSGSSALTMGFALTEAQQEGAAGCVYVGGTFEEAGTLDADNVARWCCLELLAQRGPIAFDPQLDPVPLHLIDRNGDGLPEEVECDDNTSSLPQDTTTNSCGYCIVVGTPGADVLSAPNGCPSLMFGGDGDDTITGSNQDDVISGGGDHDQISGGPGRDRLVGDDGDDQLRGGEGDDAIGGGPGNDALDGGADGQMLPAGAGRDLLAGGPGADSAILRSDAVVREAEIELCPTFPADPGCTDQCPSNPNKILPGLCGCALTESDTDEDGTPDCNDACPGDPAKTAPGACGCGESDADVDGDGLAGCNDNCRGDVNPGQADADGDDTGDACDRDADNDFIVDDVDTCPAVSALDRDLDHDGCRDTTASLAAMIRKMIEHLEEAAAGDEETLSLLNPAMRKLIRVAELLEEGKPGRAFGGLRTAVKAFARAASRGVVVDVEHHVDETANVARVIALLAIDAAQAAPGADPGRIAKAVAAYSVGMDQLEVPLYVEAIGAFRIAARHAFAAI